MVYFSSDRLYVITIDSHGHRPLNRIDRNDQAVVAILRHKHAFHSVHRPTAYPDPLPHLEKGVRSPGRRLRQNLLDAFDLLIGNRQARAVNAHKTVNALHLVHTRPVGRAQSAADEHIATEKWHFDFLLAIAPAMHFHRRRQEGFHALISQSSLDRFFVARSGVQRVPTQLFLRYPLAYPAARFIVLVGTTHSFALWVPLHWVRLVHMLDRMADLFNAFRGRKATGTTHEQLRGNRCLNLTALARMCKWQDFLGHNVPIYAPADLLMTKLNSSETLFHGTPVVVLSCGRSTRSLRHP